MTSQSYQVLENVKAYDETVTTVYVMRFAYGNTGALSAADHFSVDAVSVTGSLVSRVHNAGRQLYVWTVNTRKSIEKMIGLNVDNIITDDVTLPSNVSMPAGTAGCWRIISICSSEEAVRRQDISK